MSIDDLFDRNVTWAQDKTRHDPGFFGMRQHAIAAFGGPQPAGTAG